MRKLLVFILAWQAAYGQVVINGSRTTVGAVVNSKATSTIPSLVGIGAPAGSTCNEAKVISSSTNATPIVVTSTAHGFSNGDVVTVYNHATNTAANAVWMVGSVATNTFTLCGYWDGTTCQNPSVGNGVGGATGFASRQVGREYFRQDAAYGNSKYYCSDVIGSPAWMPSVTISSNGTIGLGSTLPVNIFTSHITNGNQDIYTPASGRKAILTAVSVYNDSAGTPTGYPAIKIGGTYYPVASSTATIAANTAPAPFPINVILDSTTTLAFNAGTTAVINVWATLLEFDANIPVFTKYVTTFNAGSGTTLYTVAAGKKACLLSNGTNAGTVATLPTNSGFSTHTLGYFNSSGGSRTLTANIVPSGGSVATTNQVMTSTVVTDKSVLAKTVAACMSAGDFVSYTSDAATATQLGFVTVWEQ